MTSARTGRPVVQMVVIGGILNRAHDPSSQILTLRDDENEWRVATFHLTATEAKQWARVLVEYADDLEHAATAEATS